MEQMITKELLAEKAVEYAEQKNSAWTNDCEGFIAGAMFVMQLLQQTPCTTLLPDECKHEKSYYCFKTGGGRCRKCQKLIGQ